MVPHSYLGKALPKEDVTEQFTPEEHTFVRNEINSHRGGWSGKVPNFLIQPSIIFNETNQWISFKGQIAFNVESLRLYHEKLVMFLNQLPFKISVSGYTEVTTIFLLKNRNGIPRRQHILPSISNHSCSLLCPQWSSSYKQCISKQ